MQNSVREFSSITSSATLASAALFESEMFESGAKTLAHDSNLARRKYGQHEAMRQHASDDHDLEKVC